MGVSTSNNPDEMGPGEAGNDSAPAPEQAEFEGLAAPSGTAAEAADAAGRGVDAARAALGSKVGSVNSENIAHLADPSNVRRVPRYGRFALAGVVGGMLLALILAFVAKVTEADFLGGGGTLYLDRGGLFLLLAALLAPIGALGGCAAAVMAERRARRPHA